MEQNFPVLYHRYALREGSGGTGRHRGGLGLDYELELRRGDARASFVMDHGRFGPQGALGGGDGAVNEVEVWRDGVRYIPDHLSKEQDIALKAGDRVRVKTPAAVVSAPPPNVTRRSVPRMNGWAVRKALYPKYVTLAICPRIA